MYNSMAFSRRLGMFLNFLSWLYYWSGNSWLSFTLSIIMIIIVGYVSYQIVSLWLKAKKNIFSIRELLEKTKLFQTFDF